MEQEAICRVCRCEGSVEQPLFHPCKCSGSIRYVHQDCLMEWLAHSRKKHCELCEHPYSFTPVYRMDMPESIPLRLLLLQLVKKLSKLVFMFLRASLVACAWLFILPYFTINVWRFYFWSGQVLSDQILQLQNYSASINQFYVPSSSMLNVTSTGINVMPTETSFSPSDESAQNTTLSSGVPTQFVVFGQAFTTSDVKTFMADCFEGQVITFVTFVVFVAIFYLREWIVQNIPEEVLDDNIGEPLNQDIEPQEDQIHFDRDEQPPTPQGVDAPPAENERDDIDSASSTDAQAPLYLGGDNNSDPGNRHTRVSEHEMMNWPPADPSGTESRQNRRAASEPPISRHHLDVDTNAESMVWNSANQNIDRRQRAASAEPGLEWYDSLSPFDNHASSSTLHHHSLGNSQRYAQDHSDAFTSYRSPHAHDLYPIEEQQSDDDVQDHHNQRHDTPPPAPFPQQRIQQIPQPEPEPQPEPQLPPNNNAEDDILDVLEAVGMRGSLWKLIQSIFLIGLVISSCLGITVWMPYLIGMTFVMADIFDVIRVPFVLTRMITDPVIERLITLSIDVVWPATVKAIDSLTTVSSSYYSSVIPTSLRHILEPMARKLFTLIHTAMSSLSSTAIATEGTMGASAGLPQAPTFEADIFTSLESAFNGLLFWINQVEPSLKLLAAWYRNLAVGTTTMDRTICIVIGYIVALAMSSCYFSQSLARIMFGDRAHGTIRQQYLILKTGFFLAIELFLFPIVCGLLLDFSTMRLPNLSSIWASMEYTWLNPVSSIFVYWFVGMMFMVMFTWLITNCRDILRPGVMWFIRDPNDPQFHPIKEIIQRPIGSQLKKLGTSATMYALIIIIGVGGVAQAIHYFGHDFLPLQMNLSRPLIVMPFDLIIIHIIVPAINRYFRPVRVIKRFWIKWMHFVCRQLRLTSFMFGVRTMDEEGVMRYPTWWGWLHGNVLQQHNHRRDGILEWNGQLVRAPKHDGVRFIPGRRMLVPVDTTTHLPLDQREQRLGHPAARGPGGEEANTVIVYTPPRFKQRVIAFMVALWLSGSALLCSLTILPLVLGRYVFEKGFHLEVPVHDMYSYFVGGIIILLAGAFIGFLSDVINDVISQTNTTGRVTSFATHSKNIAHMVRKPLKKQTKSANQPSLYFQHLQVFKWSLIIAIFGVVIPLLFGSMMEVYILMPVRDLGDKVPHLDVLSVWIRGFACMNLVHGLLHVLPTNAFQVNLTQAFRRGVTNMDFKFLGTHVLRPLCLFCLAALLVPFLLALIVIQIFLGPHDPTTNIEVIQAAYPITTMIVGSYYIGHLVIKMGNRWMQSIREDYYLVGRTLHNMGE